MLRTLGELHEYGSSSHQTLNGREDRANQFDQETTPRGDKRPALRRESSDVDLQVYSSIGHGRTSATLNDGLTIVRSTLTIWRGSHALLLSRYD